MNKKRVPFLHNRVLILCKEEELDWWLCIFLRNDLAHFLLSFQPRVTVTSSFVYKVIMDLSSIDHLCINPIRRIGLIHK